jgi:CheY-like chemotaxis protein/two-component sensor histidine kinase
VISTDKTKSGDRSTTGVSSASLDLENLEELAAALVRTEQSSLIARLVVGATHDLSNLLTVIQASADLLVRTATDEESVAALQRIDKSVERAGRKLVQMKGLGLAHVAEESPTPLHVNPLVDEVLSLTRARWKDEAERAGVRYEVRWHPGLVEPVRAGSADLQAALVALVFNALEAMPRGGLLTFETGMTREGAVAITVRDEGVGMAEPNVDDLSDVFYTTQPGRKVGLGLHLVRRVAEEAGGRLEIVSEVGEGSVFTLLLPSSNEAPEAPEASLRFLGPDTRSVPTVAGSAQAKLSSGPRLLVVDDQADILQVLTAILEANGYEVDAVLRARDGLSLADQADYSVILTDLGMPDMSGWEFAAEVKKKQPQAPVILMTGWGAEVDEKRLSDEGIFALLPKPFGGKDLLVLLDEALAGT